MNTQDKARLAVEEIIEDMSDRRGLRQAWDMTDPEIQEEIINHWSSIIEKHLAQDN